MTKVEKIDKATINFIVYSELRSSLMLGKIKPGASLRIQELADQFGTSHMPVREALRRLVSEQALEVLSNRSVAVPPADKFALRGYSAHPHHAGRGGLCMGV